MFEISLHPVKDEVRQRAHLDNEAYQRLYRQSIEQPDAFWGEQARQFDHARVRAIALPSERLRLFNELMRL